MPSITIVFGGSWGQARISEPGPDPAMQIPVWNEIGDLVIQYPGDKKIKQKKYQYLRIRIPIYPL